MKLFELHRDVDKTGVSGTGKVAQGVIFANGKCALTWLTDHTSVAIYDDIATVVAIHGHAGSTRVVQVANIDIEVGARCSDNLMLDDMENVGPSTAANSQYVWKEREKLAAMFHPIELAPVPAR